MPLQTDRRERVPFPDKLGPKIIRLCASAFLTLALLAGCTERLPPKPPPVGTPRPYRVGKSWYQPLSHARDFRQQGKASWYGTDFHGRRTSSGEVYDMHAMTAAHKTLPFDTHVRVNNLDNQRTVEVRINDRGPFVQGRIIDLSKSAASALGMLGPGTANVEIVALGTVREQARQGKIMKTYVPQDYFSGNFTFQVGAFKNRENAERFQKRMAQAYKNAHVTVFNAGAETFYRVRVGHCTTLEQAEAYESLLEKNGFKDAFIVAE